MDAGRSRVRSWVAAGVLASLLAGCVGPRSTAPPASSSSPASSVAPIPFTLEVVPEMSVGRTIGGSRVVYLVSVAGQPGDGAVDLVADAAGASIAIEPQPLTPGIVGEVTIVPEAVSQDVDLQVAISGSRGGVTATVERTLGLSPGDDTLGPEAEGLLDRFVAWLATERPDLGIDAAVPWEGTPGGWVLVVNHYSFFSEAWEMGLSWHVMIPPDDWARIWLRRRWSESRPSLAFEIPSVAGELEPHEIEPPDEVWR